jgi:hypothetical protein
VVGVCGVMLGVEFGVLKQPYYCWISVKLGQLSSYWDLKEHTKLGDATCKDSWAADARYQKHLKINK